MKVINSHYWRYSTLAGIAILVLALTLSLISSPSTVTSQDNFQGMYRVTIENLSSGQPLSPPVAATHPWGVTMFQRGVTASPELEAIAEDGNQGPMVSLLEGLDEVTEVVDIGGPLAPQTDAEDGPDTSATFTISAGEGDKFSFAAMLICTNDGFAGLSRVNLPQTGSVIYWVNAYDAGTENNTKDSADLVDPCSELGPVELPGDPNGNENDSVATDPQESVALHPGISGSGDLDGEGHAWDVPVAKVTITRIDQESDDFIARLSGIAEVPHVETVATGQARFQLDDAADELSYRLSVAHIIDVTAAHIHVGLPNENGPVVAFLFGPAENTDVVHRNLSIGKVTPDDLTGPLEGDWDGFLEALRNGGLYANVHTQENPAGEIRGQIGMDSPPSTGEGE